MTFIFMQIPNVMGYISFLVGFVFGAYSGTRYNLLPIIERIENYLYEKLPPLPKKRDEWVPKRPEKRTKV